MAEALQHAHTRGLIHRDIKPENVILTTEGNVKLADLGLARLTADEKWAMAEAGMAIGTPYYISPEQVRGQVDVDIRADIYSLGATFYHMVTGQVPYDGETPNEVMRKHLDKATPLVPPDHINTKLSSGVGEVIETMMAKNREDRYRHPNDLMLDLKCLLQGERPMIAAPEAREPDLARPGRSRRGPARGHIAPRRGPARRDGRLRQQPEQHHRRPGLHPRRLGPLQFRHDYHVRRGDEHAFGGRGTSRVGGMPDAAGRPPSRRSARTGGVSRLDEVAGEVEGGGAGRLSSC